jgi:hypothetical protein
VFFGVFFRAQDTHLATHLEGGGAVIIHRNGGGQVFEGFLGLAHGDEATRALQVHLGHTRKRGDEKVREASLTWDT